MVRTKKPELDRHHYGHDEEQGHFYNKVSRVYMNEDYLKQVLVDAGVDGLLRIEVPDSKVELQPRVSAALILASKCMR